MKLVQIGTVMNLYPFVPMPHRVHIGTTPFRGVPFVPEPDHLPFEKKLKHFELHNKQAR